MQEFNTGGRMNLQQQVNNVAAQGRYGDSMLMHVNPAEVRGLSQVAPITINPETGQPEAFLPFLAPLLGSFLGSAALTGVGAGIFGAGGLSSLAAGALGSGLAQWAATGDIKKGLLAGITGYGIGSALQGAGAAAAGTGEAAKQTAALTTDATNTLLQDPTMVTQGTQALNTAGQTALNTTMAAGQPGIQYAGQAAADAYTGAGTGALKDAFSGTFGEGMKNLAAGASQPMAMAGIAGGMAPTAVMESEELFARQTAQMEKDEEERKRQMWLDSPEPILYSAQGGPTNMDESLMMDVNLLSGAMNAGGRTGYDYGGEIGFSGGYNGPNTFSGDQQRFTPARQAYDINPAFMAGFQPETMYFQPNTINQPATATTTGGMPILNDPYTGSQGGYNTMGVAEAPLQTIDPYAAYTGSAPQGLVETGFNPVPVPELPVAPVTPPGTPPGTPPVTPPVTPPWVDPWDNPYDIPFELGDLRDLEDKYGISPGDFMPNGEGDFDPSTFDPSGYNLPDLTNLDPDTFNLPDGNTFTPPMPEDYGMNNTPFSLMQPPMQPPAMIPEPIQPVMQPPSVGTPPPYPMGQNPYESPIVPGEFQEAQGTPVGLNPDGTPYTSPLPLAAPGVPVGPTPMPPSIMQPPAMPTPPGLVSTPLAPSDKPMLGTGDPSKPKPGDPRKPETPTVGNISTNENGHTADEIRDMIVGTAPMPAGVNYNMADAQQLQAQDASLIEQPSSPVRPTRGGGGRGGRGRKAEGGETGNIMQDPITQEVVLFITGESDNQQAVNDFVTKYGAETFAQLRDYVLKALTNESVQTEGQIEGVGNSGMADDIPGMIGANEKIAVSQDEFIVPADVVSALGDGSSDAGSNELYAMMDRVRQEKTGTTRQAPKLANAGGLLPR